MKDGGRGMRTGMVQRRQGVRGASVENARRRPFTADGWSSPFPVASNPRSSLFLNEEPTVISFLYYYEVNSDATAMH